MWICVHECATSVCLWRVLQTWMCRCYTAVIPQYGFTDVHVMCGFALLHTTAKVQCVSQCIKIYTKTDSQPTSFINGDHFERHVKISLYTDLSMKICVQKHHCTSESQNCTYGKEKMTLFDTNPYQHTPLSRELDHAKWQMLTPITFPQWVLWHS